MGNQSEQNKKSFKKSKQECEIENQRLCFFLFFYELFCFLFCLQENPYFRCSWISRSRNPVSLWGSVCWGVNEIWFYCLCIWYHTNCFYLGFNVNFHTYKNVGHSVSQQEITDGNAFALCLLWITFFIFCYFLDFLFLLSIMNITFWNSAFFY